MEHYYVIEGCEFGMGLDTKKNFVEYDKAKIHFDERVKSEEAFVVVLNHVDENGNEKEIDSFCEED